MFRVLKHARIPLFSNRKSNHIFTIWQHIVLIAIRQYEGKSYRMFVEWLIKTYYLRSFLRLSRIPHFTTLQKFTDRINNSLLEKIISSFIVIQWYQAYLCRHKYLYEHSHIQIPICIPWICLTFQI